ncbi:hypothetical protein CXF78_10930 [Shewanella sp. 11B5]|uniref:hypothetical protein n=1 Tax=Shewanella sp. 11B5 TaxID=2058298 RepID=UPI000C7CECAB|nr:hypothetical protein [Shewanella sp. 11B5]PKI03793.1 hypothetical protein CXF78_10930 [Shewanella sp. 11B5]
MLRPKGLLNRIRYILNIKLIGRDITFLKGHYFNNYNVIYIPQPPYLRPKFDTVGIKITNGINVSLEKITISGFSEAINLNGYCSAKMKKVSIDNCEIGIFANEAHIEKDKKMALDLKRVDFSRGKKGVVAPDTYDIKARDVKFQDVEIGFDIYLSKAKMLEIGLPENTPKDLIFEAIEIVKNSKEEETVDKLSKSELFSWLGMAANTVTIATPLVKNLMALVQ